MKILFSNAYFYPLDPKQWQAHQPYAPLGTLYAASLIRHLGHEVRLFDTNLIDDASLIQESLDNERPDWVVIYDDGFNYLTKMCLTVMREAAMEMIKLSKANACQVAICSSDSTDHYDKYLDAGADVVILGEGEKTLEEIFSLDLIDDTSLASVSGLAYRQKDKTKVNPKRAVLRNLDELPMPAWDLVNIEAYKNIWISHHGYFRLNIATTRGCPFKCNWCAKPIYGNRYHAHSPAYIIRQIEELLQLHPQLSSFWMCDDIFGLKPGWVQEFRDLVKKSNLKFSYKIQSRVDLLLQADTIDALVESGLEEVWVGAESGSQKILDAMDKGTKVEQIHKATHLLREKGVRVCFFLQFGYLGETEKDIQLTLDMLFELMPDDIGISVSYPLPGTGFYEKVKNQLVHKANWTDSDDLDMMYEATFSPEYYKKLHRYVHKKYRYKQGMDELKKLFEQPFHANSKRIKKALSPVYYGPTASIDQLKLKRYARIRESG